MRANVVKFLAIAAMTALAGCSNEEIVYVGSDSSALLPAGQDVIKISLSNSSLTRAPRPIGTSEPDNNINRIAFKFVTSSGEEDTNVKLAGVIKDGDADIDGESEEYTDNVLPIAESDFQDGDLEIKFTGLQANSSYKIIAYGYNCDDGNETVFPYKDHLSTPQRITDGFYYSCSVDVEQDAPLEEIFAGCNEDGSTPFIGVNQHGKFKETPKITLRRQVAGLLAYMSEVPAFVENQQVYKITVSTYAKPAGFKFPNSLVSPKDGFNGMSGTADNENVDLLTFDMRKASNFKELEAENKVGSGELYKFDKEEGGSSKEEGKKYLLAEGMNEADFPDLECDDNTLFGSCFLLPFWQGLSLNIYNAATLNICYWDKNGQLIKQVPLRMKSEAGSNFTDAPDLSGDNYQYDIRCNNFYSIGTKKTLDNPGTDDPNADEDQPISIDEPTGYHSLDLSIDDTWVDNSLIK